MPNDTFIWTDELVREFYLGARKEPSYPIKQRIEDFKQSKIKEKEIEVTDLQYYGDKHRGDNKWTFMFNLNTDNVPTDKYNALKDAMETALNDEPIEGMTDWAKMQGLEIDRNWSKKDIDKMVDDTVNQPLTGELITLEECQRREAKAYAKGKLDGIFGS